jgi:hypothetical protein
VRQQTFDQIDFPRGRPKKEDLRKPLATNVEPTKPRLVPQVIIEPYVPKLGVKVVHFDENHRRLLDSDSEASEPEPQPANAEILKPSDGKTNSEAEPAPKERQDDPIPDLDPIMADEPEGLVTLAPITEPVPEVTSQSKNHTS